MSGKKLFVSIAIIVTLVGGIAAAKKIWFPTIQNVWFQLDERQLQAAPGNLVVFRETLLGNRKSGCQTAWMGNRPGQNSEPIVRYSGRNVSLQEIIPIAYEVRPSDLVMPEVAPTNRYDFLVTATKQPAERLQEAIAKKTGFVADWQQHESDVWLLKVQNPNVLPTSTNTASNIQFQNGYLVFSHMPISTLIGFISQHLARPLEDKTELSGFYDFSLSFNWNARDSMDDKTLKTILGKLGLTIETSTTTRQMLVVHRK